MCGLAVELKKMAGWINEGEMGNVGKRDGSARHEAQAERPESRWAHGTPFENCFRNELFGTVFGSYTPSCANGVALRMKKKSSHLEGSELFFGTGALQTLRTRSRTDQRALR